MVKVVESHTGDSRVFPEEEQTLEQLTAQAVDAAAKGENIEQVLEVMLATLSKKEKEKVRAMFSAMLTQRGLRQPKGDPDIAPRNTLSRIRKALAVSTKQMIDRIMLLVRLKPDVAARIQAAGRVLLKNGVAVEKTSVPEAELGTISPSTARSTGQGQARGGVQK